MTEGIVVVQSAEEVAKGLSITTWKKVAVRYIVVSFLRYQVIAC